MLDIMRLGSSPVDLIKVLDMCDAQSYEQHNIDDRFANIAIGAKSAVLNSKKYSILTNLLKNNRTEYIATVNFLKTRKLLLLLNY